MTQRTIGIIVAMPEESKFLLKNIHSVTRSKIGTLPVYRFSPFGRDFVLIESGIGPDRALAAVQMLTETCAPALIISMGFAGAISSALAPGDVIIGSRIFICENESLSEVLTRHLQPLPDGGHSSWGEGMFRLTEGAIISTAHIQSKLIMAGLLPPDVEHAVLDMETGTIARFTTLAGIPLMAIRSISDEQGEELGFTMDEFMNSSQRVSIFKVLLTVLRKPWIIPQLARLARNTNRAGTNLARIFDQICQNLG